MRAVKVKKNRVAWKILKRDFFELGTYSDNTISAAFKLIETRARRCCRNLALDAKKRGDILDYKFLNHRAASYYFAEDTFEEEYDRWRARHPRQAEKAQKIRDRMWAEEEEVAESIDLGEVLGRYGDIYSR